MSAKNLYVYVVEYRSNDYYLRNRHKEKMCDVNPAHYASSLKKAIEWIKDGNEDYGGKPGMKDYKPWHWEVWRYLVNEDSSRIVHSHIKRMIVLNPDGTEK